MWYPSIFDTHRHWVLIALQGGQSTGVESMELDETEAAALSGQLRGIAQLLRVDTNRSQARALHAGFACS